MKLTDPHSEAYPIVFQATHTFISAPGDSLLTVAGQYLARIDAEDRTVYVTDPYLFPAFSNPTDEAPYETDLCEILERSGAKVIVFCAKEKKNAALFTRVESHLNSRGICLTFDNRLSDCHDRFWYCPETEKCIVFGTSLNGIGKKTCRIDELCQEEVVKIRQMLETVGILQSCEDDEH